MTSAQISIQSAYMTSQPASSVRLPKLSYRNKSADAVSINTVSTSGSTFTVSTNPTSPPPSTFCPSPREPPVDLTKSIHTAPPSAKPSAASRTPRYSSKKRPGFLHGLFGAKEPSAQAFADYQKQLLKQKDGRLRTSTIGLPGVSSARLPPTVPKVNSKWDGVPEALKEREKQKQGRQSFSEFSRGTSTVRSAGSDSRPSATSASKRRMSRGTLGGTSTHSDSSTNRLADLYGWEARPNTMTSSSSAVVDFAIEHRPTTSRMQTSHSAPPPTKSPPPLERSTLFPPHTSSICPTSSPPYYEQPSPTTPGSPPVLSHSNSPALSPVDLFPVTPDASSNSVSPHFEASLPDDIRTTLVDAPASVDEVIIRSAGLNILGPPATAKRRAKVTSPQAGGDRPLTAGHVHLNSILKKDATENGSPNFAMTSYFPGPASGSPAAPVRRNSARDRLGLGIRLKNQGTAPWSSSDSTGDFSATGERIVTPTPEGVQSLKRKGRMSMFKK